MSVLFALFIHVLCGLMKVVRGVRVVRHHNNMTKTITFSISKTVELLVLAFITSILLLVPSVLFAAEDDALDLVVRDMKAELTFTRSTPCAPYKIEWGDGTTEDVPAIGDMCIQVLDTVNARHTYETDGSYEVTLTLNSGVYTVSAVVPTEVPEFSLSDVESIDAEWVDPSPMMADEEYYIYTIVLKDGTEVTAKVAGFTMIEWRDQAFLEAGYTGDVSALLELANDTETPTIPPVLEESEPEVPIEEESTTDARELKLELLALLKKAVAQLTALLNMR